MTFSKRFVMDRCEELLARCCVRLVEQHSVPVLTIGVTLPPGEVGKLVICSAEGTTDAGIRRYLRKVLELLEQPPEIRLDGSTAYQQPGKGDGEGAQP